MRDKFVRKYLSVHPDKESMGPEFAALFTVYAHLIKTPDGVAKIRSLFDEYVDVRNNMGTIIQGTSIGVAAPTMTPVKGKNDKVNQAQKLDGGINLDPAQLALDVKGDGSVAVRALDPAQLALYRNAPGLVPVVISITPAGDVPAFLGLPAR
jgi:hypothetical protein